jgi:hypothetical protein
MDDPNDTIAAQFSEGILASIQASREEELNQKHPILVGLTIRCPIGFHRALKKASKLHNVSQTRIILQAVWPVLRALLKEKDLGQGSLLE